MSLNILLISDDLIKERTAIHGNIDPKLIYPDIKVCQDMYVIPILGSALFDKLQALIGGGTISDVANVNYKGLLDNYIVDALIYYTLSRLPKGISYQFWNKGVMRKQNENTELPSMSDLIDISNDFKNTAEFYGNRLKLYLIQNAVAKFPEYLQPGNGIDTVNPSGNSFSSPIYLGDEYDNPYCNKGGFTRKPYSE